MGNYDVAQVCLNGHMVNDSVGRSPEFNQKFCDTCGAETITKCPSCGNNIQGRYHGSGLVIVSSFEAKAFCHNCGKPFPWTEAKIKAAKELSQEIEGLSAEERQQLEKSIDDIVRETPGTPLAATRFKKILSKAGKATAGAFRDILVDITSEAAKKMIWP